MTYFLLRFVLKPHVRIGRDNKTIITIIIIVRLCLDRRFVELFVLESQELPSPPTKLKRRSLLYLNTNQTALLTYSTWELNVGPGCRTIGRFIKPTCFQSPPYYSGAFMHEVAD